jgi:hypothetical protein
MTTNTEIKKRLKIKHVEDFMSLARIYLFDTGSPFEFRSDEEEIEFMTKFLELGHDHTHFPRCKCRGDKKRKWWN